MTTIDTIRRDAFSSNPIAGHSPRFPGIGQLVVNLFDRLELMAQKRRSRRLLLEMSDEQLKDIGISRSDACREGLRPFWD